MISYVLKIGDAEYSLVHEYSTTKLEVYGSDGYIMPDCTSEKIESPDECMKHIEYMLEQGARIIYTNMHKKYHHPKYYIEQGGTL